MASSEQKSVQRLTELSDTRFTRMPSLSTRKGVELSDSFKEFGSWEDGHSQLETLVEAKNKAISPCERGVTGRLATAIQGPTKHGKDSPSDIPKLPLGAPLTRPDPRQLTPKTCQFSRRFLSSAVDPPQKAFPPRIHLSPLSLTHGSAPRASEQSRPAALPVKSSFRKKRLSDCRPKLGPTILLTHVISMPALPSRQRRLIDGCRFALIPSPKVLE